MALDYTVKRSPRRRKLTITVERDRSLVVNAPEGVSDDAIAAALDKKRQWIHEKTRHAQKYEELPHPPGKELVNGESAPYLGRNYRITITEDETGGPVRFDNRFLVPKPLAQRGRHVLREWYLSQANAKILPRVKRHAQELGVEYAAAKIVTSRYQWGSCTVKNNVNFNWRLIKAPMFVIDYVIVHELAHLKESNHTPRFWNIVRTHTPKMDKAKQWLRMNGQILEDDL